MDGKKCKFCGVFLDNKNRTKTKQEFIDRCGRVWLNSQKRILSAFNPA